VIAAFRAGGRLLPRVPVPFDAYLGMTRVARDRGNAEYFYTDPLGLRAYPLGFMASLFGADLSGRHPEPSRRLGLGHPRIDRGHHPLAQIHRVRPHVGPGYPRQPTSTPLSGAGPRSRPRAQVTVLPASPMQTDPAAGGRTETRDRLPVPVDLSSLPDRSVSTEGG